MKAETQIGIWIDLNEAIIATGNEIIDVVTSEFTIGNAKGGSGSATPYGPQDSVSESKVLEKRKNTLRTYFSEIMERIEHYQEVLILGPGIIKNKLEEILRESHKTKHLYTRVETADKMTLNQFRAKIRDYFSQTGGSIN
ncbi:hypothetical protein [Ekhidna sp.]|uniref:hypothetical protein n=1 Tax=Ekhidna sp. TaxID=2608089 RepID=UPI003B50E9A6